MVGEGGEILEEGGGRVGYGPLRGYHKNDNTMPTDVRRNCAWGCLSTTSSHVFSVRLFYDDIT